jgi:hypothetical protein
VSDLAAQVTPVLARSVLPSVIARGGTIRVAAAADGIVTPQVTAVLDRMCAHLNAHVAEPVGGFTDASIDGLLEAAAESPAGFRLLFQHALREPEFSERIEKFRADITAAAFHQISVLVPDQALARWVAQLGPAVAIEAVIAWLDAEQPDPARAAARVRQAVMGVIGAATASPAECSFPPVATTEGPAS